MGTSIVGPQVFTGGGIGGNNRYNPQGSATLTLPIGGSIQNWGFSSKGIIIDWSEYMLGQ